MSKLLKTKLFLAGGICPFPKNSGGATRFYHTIKNLAKYFDIYLLFWQPSDYHLTSSDINFLEKYTRYYETISSPTHQTQNSAFSDNNPYWFSTWHQPDALLTAQRIITQNGIKIAQVETTQIAYLINAIPTSVYTIFVAYDVCTISFQRRLAEIPFGARYLVHAIRYLEIHFYEKKYLPKFNKVVAMSPVDQDEFHRLFNISNCICVPNGIESVDFLNKSSITPPIKIGLFGSFNHPPNRFAFIYFLQHIAPILSHNKIDYKLLLVGNNSTNEVHSLVNHLSPKLSSKIINLGFIKKTKDVFKKFDCLFAPLFSGSGTRVKIIEALSFGVPVITSPIGSEGIKTNNPFLAVAHTPQEYVNATKKLSSIYTSKNRLSLKKFLTPFLWSSVFSEYVKYLHTKLTHDL